MLTDDELTSDLRVAFAHASDGLTPRPGLADVVRRARRRQHLATVAALVTPVAAAGVLTMVVGAWPESKGQTHQSMTSQSQASPAQASPAQRAASPTISAHVTLTLDGYKVALPAGYSVAPSTYTVDEHCLVRGASTGPTVLVPSGMCPLHITGVVTALPAGMIRVEIPGLSADQSAPKSLVGFHSPDGSTGYLPTKSSDGATVYVTLAVGTQDNFTQVLQLAQGIWVLPVLANASGTGPVG